MRAWVEGGGALLLIADHMPFPGAAHDLAAAFGFGLRNGFAFEGARGGGPLVFRRSDGSLAGHAITDGARPGARIDSVATFTGEAFRPAPGATSLLTFRPGVVSLEPDTAWIFHDDTPHVDVGGWSQGAVADRTGACGGLRRGGHVLRAARRCAARADGDEPPDRRPEPPLPPEPDALAERAGGRAMSETFDVVLVGGGIMGCATAFELSRRGVSVAVVEKGALASGSTGRSSAIVRQHYSNEVTARMARWGLDVFRDFEERVGGESGFVNAGFLVLVPAEDGEGLRENVALQQAVGIDTRVVSPEEIRELLPGAAASDLVAAAWEPGAGYADPHMTTSGFAAAAKRDGARFFLNREVTGIRFAGGRVAGVDTSAGPIDAAAVVNCAGPWGARVAAMAGLEVPVASCRAQVAVFGRPEARRGAHPVVLDFAHASYFRPETGDLMLVGLIDPSEAEDVVDPDRYPEHTDDAFDLDGATLDPALPVDGGGGAPPGLCRSLCHHARLAPHHRRGARRQRALPMHGVQRTRLQAGTGGGSPDGRSRHG